MDISIIIPVYNDFKNLKLTLKYLHMQRGIDNKNIEIIIIDDYSDIYISEALDIASYYAPHIKNIKILRNEKNLGLATSRNIGAENSQANTLLFVDSDIITTPNVLKEHLALQKKEDVQMVVSRIFDINKRKYEEIINELSLMPEINVDYMNSNLAERMDPFFQLREDILNYKKVNNNIMWLFGTFFCTSINKKAFMGIGGFDTWYKGWGPEDIDLSYRFFKNQGIIHYCRQALCYHMDNKTRDINLLVKDITSNLKYISKKYPDKAIWYYLNFYKGSISFEEFEAFMNANSFNRNRISELHRVGIINFVKSKTLTD